MSGIWPEPSIIHEAVSRALGEDLGPLDITSHALISADRMTQARIFVKEPAVLAGNIVAEAVFRKINPSLRCEYRKKDGEFLEKGETVLEIKGSARDILSGERSALNFLQHLSGIATETARYVKAAKGTHTRILDTRKTTPGLRILEKYAVLCGGGVNHRMGLYDAFMIKDNHIALMKNHGSLAEAVQQARAFNPEAHLTVEADTLEQVRILAELNVDRILLDNMDNTALGEAVKLISKRCETEASGNMTLERIPSVATTGVDFISIGALTHSVRAVDFSLEIID